MGLLDIVLKQMISAVNQTSEKLEELQREQFESGKDSEGKTMRS